ncbi:adenine phosphoribosyltransferase [Parashewanella curva]|uniref:adenine phosphoribosyltransferase n=1 Tax=Parashewanella curva TaxID=2338552 RepID=A0A3L8PW47_9GAMM|nr:adenine phosphoribosyltransferase [Parashewanella curva]RLV59574.1 adenine phosphoribosyltransferase [Parashewanella curva]
MATSLAQVPSNTQEADQLHSNTTATSPEQNIKGYQVVQRETDGKWSDSNGMSLVGWHKDTSINTEQSLMRAMSLFTFNSTFKSNVRFCDIFSMTSDGAAFQYCCDEFIEEYKDQTFDQMAGTDARGFILGAVLAHQYGAGFVPIRKLGKLPGEVIRLDSTSEYAKNKLELNPSHVKKDGKILFTDDLLATGGTAQSSIKLIRQAGGQVEQAAFLISIPKLGGEKKMTDMGVKVYTLFEMEDNQSVINEWFNI